MPGTVLIVEDDRLNRKLFADLLGRAGYDVQLAGDGEEAVERVQETRPDLVLMDIQLPRASGIDVAAHLRRDHALGRVPIIAVTARASNRDREDIMHGEFDAYLAKPVMPDVLLAMVSRFIGRDRGPQDDPDDAAD